MIDLVEALSAVAREGSVTRAAASLRLTQSAVSKRIAALETLARTPLVVRTRSGARLTDAGRDVLRRAEPLVAGLRDAIRPRDGDPEGRVDVAVAESVLASWGADVLARVREALPGVAIAIRAHRSPMAVERVRAGECDLALVADSALRRPDLVVEPVATEDFVVAGARPRDVRSGAMLVVMSIEPASETGRAVARGAAALRAAGGPDLRIGRTLESYSCLAGLARAGFGPALLPRGIALAMGAATVELPTPGIVRTVSVAARKAALASPAVAAVRAAIRDLAPRRVSRTSRARSRRP